jgi:uncharacterized membrane protein
MDMSEPRSRHDRVIDRRHYTKNIIGLLGFTALLLYCSYRLFTTSAPGGLLAYGVLTIALLLTVVRSARRVLAIRNIISTARD